MDHTPPSLKVDKPWGKFEQYTHNLPSTVKIITVQLGGVLSLQYHHGRVSRGWCWTLGRR